MLQIQTPHGNIFTYRSTPNGCEVEMFNLEAQEILNRYTSKCTISEVRETIDDTEVILHDDGEE